MFGLGSRNPQMRSLRLVLLAAVLIAGTAFHHTGTAYTTIRVAYYAVIFGGLGYVVWRRSMSKRTTSTASGPPEPESPPDPSSPMAAVRQPGWFPDQQDMKTQRYWDGSSWTKTRRWEGDHWADT